MKLNGLKQYFETDINGKIVDFKQVDEYGRAPLMFYLIKNSDLKQIDYKWMVTIDVCIRKS